jgi:hypothetical protein
MKGRRGELRREGMPALLLCDGKRRGNERLKRDRRGGEAEEREEEEGENSPE